MKIRLLLLGVVFTAMATAAETNGTRVPAVGAGAPSVASALSKDDQAAMELGRRVLAIEQALRDPGAPDALNAVTALGLETRYYVLVRGWLSCQLAADMSIADAAKGQTAEPVRQRIAFLQRAIRAIDLE